MQGRHRCFPPPVLDTVHLPTPVRRRRQPRREQISARLLAVLTGAGGYLTGRLRVCTHTPPAEPLEGRSCNPEVCRSPCAQRGQRDELTEAVSLLGGRGPGTPEKGPWLWWGWTGVDSGPRKGSSGLSPSMQFLQVKAQ